MESALSLRDDLDLNATHFHPLDREPRLVHNHQAYGPVQLNLPAPASVPAGSGIRVARTGEHDLTVKAPTHTLARNGRVYTQFDLPGRGADAHLVTDGQYWTIRSHGKPVQVSNIVESVLLQNLATMVPL